MNILHLDDHQLFAEGLRAVLQQPSVGHRVVSAYDVESALGALEEHGDIDLVLTDLQMPGLDGQAFIQALFQRGLMIPVLVMSAVEDLWAIRRALDAGAMGFVPKALETQDIVSIIQRALEGEPYLPAGMVDKLQAMPSDAPENDIERVAKRYQITPRQLDVLRLMRDGCSNREIAQVLSISEHTVKSHGQVLFQAFEVSNRLECVRYAERAGLL